MKSVQERLNECIAIRSQLREMQCENECDELLSAMVHFVREGQAASGSFMVPSFGRRLEYTLSTKHDSYAVLRG